MSAIQRPTSPHLSIYRPQITSVTSIMHRISGVALYVGAVLLVGWLWAAAYAPMTYSRMHECLSSLPGMGLLAAWTAAFYYHLSNGIRHLFWDMGKGLDIGCAARSGWFVLVLTLLLTVFTWGFALNSVGM